MPISVAACSSGGWPAQARTLRRLPRSARLSPQGECRLPYGFAKSERENIGTEEPTTLREIAAAWLKADAAALHRAVDIGELQEVFDEDREDQA